jgi:hypothetical protein
MDDMLPVICNAAAPRLQHVHISIKADEVSLSTSMHRQLFSGGTPVLNSICLSGLCHRLAPPLAGITLINLSVSLPNTMRPDWRELRDMLSTSPSLTNLTIGGINPVFPLDADLPDIKIPSLRCLSLNFQLGDNTNFIRIFAILDIPRLKFLELDGMSGHDLNELVHTFLQYRLSHLRELQSLTLSRCGPLHGLENDTLSHFFGFMPEVTDLCLNDTDSEFLLESRWEGQRGPDGAQLGLGVGRLVSCVSSPPWPKLTATTFRTTSRLQMGCLLTLIRRRIASRNRLTIVRIPSEWLNPCEEAWTIKQLVPVVEMLPSNAEQAFYDVKSKLTESHGEEASVSRAMDVDTVEFRHRYAWIDSLPTEILENIFMVGAINRPPFDPTSYLISGALS